MIWPLLAILTLLAVLWLSAPLLKGGKYSRGAMSLFLTGFTALSLSTYALIGSPELLKEGALTPYQEPRGPSPAQMQAAQEMTPQERAEMINAMVEGLAARLDDNPNDPQGWARLLRARKVLGQEKKLQADIDRVKLIFKDSPETIDMILGPSN